MPATALGRLAWHYLINGGWKQMADEYVFDTRRLTNHQPYFAAYIKVKDLLTFTDRLELVQDDWGYLLLWATLAIACITAAYPGAAADGLRLAHHLLALAGQVRHASSFSPASALATSWSRSASSATSP